MPIETIEFNGQQYPAFQAEGNAMQFALPTFKRIIKDEWRGFDIGCNRHEWCYPGAMPIDPGINKYDAMNLPDTFMVEYIVSSHMLEHFIGRFQDVIEYWLTRLKPNGVICLYLPNGDYQKYWAWGNKKHIHYLRPALLKEYCEYLHITGMISKFFVTDGHDANGSFYCFIENV